MRLHRVTLLFLLAVTSPSAANDRDLLRKNFLGKAPPEIVSDNSDWLGQLPPTSLAAHKDQVIWLQFNF